MLAVGLRRGVQQHQVDITPASRRCAVGELETIESKWMTFVHTRQMPALVEVLNAHALATQRQLSAELPDGRRSSHATLRVQDRKHGRANSCLTPRRRLRHCGR